MHLLRMFTMQLHCFNFTALRGRACDGSRSNSPVCVMIERLEPRTIGQMSRTRDTLSIGNEPAWWSFISTRSNPLECSTWIYGLMNWRKPSPFHPHRLSPYITPYHPPHRHHLDIGVTFIASSPPGLQPFATVMMQRGYLARIQTWISALFLRRIVAASQYSPIH